MRRMIVSFACATLLISNAGLAFAKASCNPPAEVSAVQIRQLQIEMMVSTLRCDSSSYDFRSHYGAFMEKMNPLLPDNAKKLRTVVSRLGKGNFDQYLTSMSNDAQMLSQQDPLYCGSAVRLLDQVAASDTKDVPTIAAQAISAPYQVVACAEKPEAKPKGKGHKRSAG